LGAQVTKDVGEDGNTEHYDQHCPTQFEIVCWQYVTVTHSCTCDRCPVESCNVFRIHALVLQIVSAQPILKAVKVELGDCHPEAARNMKDQAKLQKRFDDILDFNFNVKVFEYLIQVLSCVPCPAQLRQQHELV